MTREASPHSPHGPPPRHALALDRVPDGFFTADPTGRLVEVDSTVEFLTGRPAAELQGRALEEFCVPGDPGEERDSLGELLREEEGALLEALLLRREGDPIPVEVSAHRLADGRIRGVIRDISARKELEEQLRISQRIESLGRLAGGIAHDFNNLITIISGHTDLLMAAVGEGSPLRADLREIRSAADRAAALTRQLLAFSRRQVFEMRTLDLNQVVSGTEGMLRRIIGEDVELVVLASPDLWPVRGDPAQLEQVIMNLVVNARDAMPRGGQLLIRTGNVELDRDFVRRNLGARVGPHVFLEVRDTGVGMTPDVLARVFEPFFTTKGPGEGTGLGLAMVYGVVKQSNGYVSVESEPGVGTSVVLYFPRARGETDPFRPELARELDELERGTETVLLVEDEELVRSLARRILESLGYTVLEVANPVDAPSAARAAPGGVQLLLTDVVMPRLGGRELAEALLREFPAMRVLFMSGYTDDALLHHGALLPGQGFLQKPFTPSSLSRKVREVLDGGGENGREEGREG